MPLSSRRRSFRCRLRQQIKSAYRSFHEAWCSFPKAWREWHGWIFRVLLVLSTCGFLLVIITLSLLSTAYPLHFQYDLIGNELEPETLLQFVGGINKFMDSTVAASISFLSAVWISFGMLRRKSGATVADFDIAECLTNPFKAVYTIPCCFRQDKEISPLCRFLNVCVRVLTSVCVVLLPISINTLLMPKLIWHPLLNGDGFPQTRAMNSEICLISPMEYVIEVSWTNPRTRSTTLLGEMDGSTNLLAAQIFEAFHDVSIALTRENRGWYTAKRYPTILTAIDTSPSRARAVTVRAEDVQRLWQQSKTYGPRYARHALEFWGNWNVSTPYVAVTCEVNKTLSMLPTGAIHFHDTPDNSTTTRVDLGGNSSLNFTSHTCHITTSHALYGVGAWTLPKYDAQINASTALAADRESDGKPTFTLTATPPNFAANVHRPVIDTLRRTYPALSALSSTLFSATTNNNDTADPFLLFLLRVTRTIQAEHSDYKTDSSVLSHLLAFWSQHLLTLSSWTLSPLSSNTTEYRHSRPTWYKIYAAGPRLRWEFAILLVPFWLFTVLFVGVCWTIAEPMKPLECTTGLAGMLFVRKEQCEDSDVGHRRGLETIRAEEEVSSELYRMRVIVGGEGSLEILR